MGREEAQHPKLPKFQCPVRSPSNNHASLVVTADWSTKRSLKPNPFLLAFFSPQSILYMLHPASYQGWVCEWFQLLFLWPFSPQWKQIEGSDLQPGPCSEEHCSDLTLRCTSSCPGLVQGIKFALSYSPRAWLPLFGPLIISFTNSKNLRFPINVLELLHW